MPTKSPDELNSLAVAIFRAAGAADEESRIVGRHLVDANLAGHDSHGILRVPQYVRAIRDGRIRLQAKPRVVHEMPAGVVVNGQLAFGQVVAIDAMQLAVEKARVSGTCSVTVFNSNHVGRLASHTMLAAAQGMIGILAVNAGGSGQLVAPFGGIAARLATNPISIAVPSPAGAIVLDIATSVAPEGKIRAARQRGEHVPQGWIVDHVGRPTTDPADFYGPPAGALLPLGGPAGHKGFGLAFMLDILAGGLSGAGCSRKDARPSGDGLFLIAIDVRQFTPLDDFSDRVTQLIDHVKSSPPAAGVLEVMIPGEFEQRSERIRREHGINVEEATWTELLDIARELGVSVE